MRRMDSSANQLGALVNGVLIRGNEFLGQSDLTPDDDTITDTSHVDAGAGSGLSGYCVTVATEA